MERFTTRALVTLAFLSSCHAWKFRLLSGDLEKPPVPYKEFSFDTAQRCYSLYNNCWNNKGQLAYWSGLPSTVKMALYADTECKGKYTVGTGRATGTVTVIRLYTRNFTDQVSSFMVWQSGMYPTNGFSSICYDDESAALLTADDALSSSSNSSDNAGND